MKLIESFIRLRDETRRDFLIEKSTVPLSADDLDVKGLGYWEPAFEAGVMEALKAVEATILPTLKYYASGPDNANARIALIRWKKLIGEER